MEKNNDLSSQLGLGDLSEEDRAGILAKAGQLVQRKILLRIEKEMSEEEREKFEKFLEEKGDNPDEVEKYLRENVPNIDEITKEEIEETRKDILGQMEELGL